MLWGAGTAVGEVPPYAITYHATKAGRRSAEVEAMLGVTSADSGGEAKWAEEAEGGGRSGGLGMHMLGASERSVLSSPLVCCLIHVRAHPPARLPLGPAPCAAGDGGNLLSRLVGRMKNWMLGFIEAHGFWGILLLAAYPNAAFDLCGMCCGHFLMPFWEFFGATLIGKAGIKVGGRWGKAQGQGAGGGAAQVQGEATHTVCRRGRAASAALSSVAGRRSRRSNSPLSLPQVAGQTAFFVALFREQTRERLFAFVEAIVPDRLPFLILANGLTPAQVRPPAAQLRTPLPATFCRTVLQSSGVSPHLGPHSLTHALTLTPPCPVGQAAHQLVNTKIAEFQAGVAHRAAAQAADPRWFYEKALATLGSWSGVRAAAAAAVPSPWGAVVLLMIGSFVSSVVQQLAQGHAAERDRLRLEAEVAKLLKQQ